jgi:hypothetical protein
MPPLLLHAKQRRELMGRIVIFQYDDHKKWHAALYFLWIIWQKSRIATKYMYK